MGVALAVWVGIVAGLIVALGGFDDPRVGHNAWVRLLTLGATIAALGWAFQTGSLALARRLQLGVALSLLLHTMLAIGLANVVLSAVEDTVAQAAPEAPVIEEHPVPPELVVVDRERAEGRPEFEAPLATGSPELAPDAMASSTSSIAKPAPLLDPEDALLEPPQPATVEVELPQIDANVDIEAPSVSPDLRALPNSPAAAGALPLLVEAAEPPVADLPPREAPRLARIEPRPRISPQVPEVSLPVVRSEFPLQKPTPLPPRRDTDDPVLSLAPESRRALPRSPASSAALPMMASTDENPPFSPPAPRDERDARLAGLPRPAPLALVRSRGGLAGLDLSPNVAFDQPAAANFPEVDVPGAASQRAPTQIDPGDKPDLSPAASKLLARVEEDSASATLLPERAAAEVAGDRDPSETNATASANPERATSDAPRAELTANAGEQPIDARSPAVAPGAGAGAGVAGGQPELSLQPSERRTFQPRIGAGLMATLPLETTPAVSEGGAVQGGRLPGVSPATESTQGASAASPAVSPFAPPDLLAGGGPRQPRRSRGPAPSITPAITAPPATVVDEALGAPPRLAMRGERPGIAAPGLGSPAPLDPAVLAGLAAGSSRSMGLPRGMAPSPIVDRSDERKPAAAFRRRGNRPRDRPGAGPDPAAPRTEAAIELGLKFLARQQRGDGSWSFSALRGAEAPAAERPSIRADAAATGLALLALLGGGYDHFGGEYQATIKSGLGYLVRIQKTSGELFPEDPGAGGAAPFQVARFYSHGIAAIALCEAYGMTGDPQLRRPAQLALNYIRDTQVSRLGGWRYTPGMDSDLSVSGWQLMALKSGEMAGLRVDRATYTGVSRYLERCRERSGDRARFCYNPLAPTGDPRKNHGRRPGTVMTSVGLLMQLYLGEPPTSRRSQRGADHLLENLPRVGDAPGKTSTLGNPLRDTYYWYYATQVMFHMKGRYWSAWNDALRPLLLESQTIDGPMAGSWSPLTPTPDRWAPHGGRLYVTAMNLLSLEVDYRHLPLYGEVERRR